MLIIIWSLTLPAATLPGQRTMTGMRKPPSSNSVFMPLNGQILENRSPPLSLVKMTIVFCERPWASSACRMRPTLASMLCTMAA